MKKKSDLWFRFHRLGGSYNGSFGHAFGDYWDRFHKQHPDWFALQPDGTRDNSQPEHAGYPSQRLCVSNQGLIEQVAQDVMEKLEKNPQLDAVSVSPNDGGKQTFCLCKKCESWDAPEGKIVQMKSKNGPIPHVSLTDRYVKFYSEIAKIVVKKYPNRYIGAYAYHLYLDAPIHAKLHPNVVIGFVPGSKVYQNDTDREQVRNNWLKWSKTAKHLFLRPNSLMALHALPTVYVHKLGEDFNYQYMIKWLKLEPDMMRYPEDLGMQVGPMLSPKNFRKYIKPVYQRLMRPARDKGCIVHMHSDGDIRTLTDDLIDGGVEVINLQDLVNGIDWIAGKFAGRTCIDLDIDRQNITARGTPEQIDNLIKEEVEKLASPRGGLMMIYDLYPGVPIENIKALMDAMEKYATYYS